MKRLSIFFLFIILLGTLMSCEKEENRIYLEQNEVPVLSASTLTPALNAADSLKEAIKFSWTNPEFRFTTGVNSQDVNYILEIDTAGANFTGTDKVSLGINRELTRSFQVRELNDFILNTLKMANSVEHSLEARVKASIGTSAASAFSNNISFKATPYAIPPKVTPPATGRLFIVGNATPAGWNNPVPEATNEFTKISETLYELTISLVGGGNYLLLPTNGDWTKYAVTENSIAGLSEGGDFIYNSGEDFPGPAAAGTYKITVDFQRGKFTVIKQ
ncbi:SusE domain-containing protein [Flavihumibacter sp. UBA7668]|uniref:SusE domain-containing protein n=1 Tax=Flavihumibacter sp. UBA7668 TaxID=1946542 RepID=UPI0025BD6423|nr:SusE domain-containing protein [Flavihumibacter sp. UBA7668]